MEKVRAGPAWALKESGVRGERGRQEASRGEGLLRGESVSRGDGGNGDGLVCHLRAKGGEPGERRALSLAELFT